MVIDTSVLIAILLGEPEAEDFSRLIAGDSKRLISAFSGDCCSYALSRSSGEPLLFKGNDFPQTDVVVAGRRTGEKG